ncbi:MFS transporter [Lichenifustis flavocetrariae]|uniref:MFS transporter n=1 Tax=Lichenifustis flavocetrariae TaxID=2949735 RepID=A0AA41YVN9_9HYPH|nr:MFS transporter [Lichenifustis flavocetrariae]MCW6509426.1 MFS transporter [Lichenifustis flavocetrariae]
MDQALDVAVGHRPEASNALPGFLLLYGALYAAYGTESAYMPAFLGSHGLSLERIGLVLAAGTVVRIVAGPVAGRLADHLGARKQILTGAAGLSGVIGWAYMLAFGLTPLLAVSMAHAAATASLAPLSDALSVAASNGGRNFQYGWVRGTGSAAFVCGTLLSGQLVDRFGLSSIIITSSVLFLIMAVCAMRVRSVIAVRGPAEVHASGAFGMLWSIPVYRRLIVVVVLVIGSHALNDAFAVINWRDSGYGSGTISLLWSESVAAEVTVFFLFGPWLIGRLGPAGAAALSAAAGVLRWTVMGMTTAMPALVGVQALHGLTFALMHLAAMGIIARSVPERLSATAQTIYGTFALGIASAVMTFASGYLYGWLGMRAFWVMAAICAAALPFVQGLRASVERDEMRAGEAT